MNMLLSHLLVRLNAVTAGASRQAPGALFYEELGKPLLLTAAVVLSLSLCVGANACLHAGTGLWISPAATCAVAVLAFALPFNYARTMPPTFKGVSGAWTTYAVLPWRGAWGSLVKTLSLIRSGSTVWDAGNPEAQRIPYGRLWFELGASALSVLIQNVMPFVSIGYMAYHVFY